MALHRLRASRGEAIRWAAGIAVALALGTFVHYDNDKTRKGVGAAAALASEANMNAEEAKSAADDAKDAADDAKSAADNAESTAGEARDAVLNR